MPDRRTLSAVLTVLFLSFLAGFLLGWLAKLAIGTLRDSDLNPNFRCYGQVPSQRQ